MSAKRRSVVGAGLSLPLLASFTSAAPDAAASAAGVPDAAGAGRLGTVSDGWVEVRWTPQGQAVLDREEVVVEPVAPARLVKDARGTAIRFPLRPSEGDPSLADLQRASGAGRLDGGVVFRTPRANFHVEELEGVLRNGEVSGTYVANGAEIRHAPVFRLGLAEGRLSTQSVAPGKPMRVKVAEVPLRPTQELLDRFTHTFGKPSFTLDTVLAHVTGEGLYTPPKG